MNGAEWRDIAGHEGWYQVSSDGQVKSLKRVIPIKGGTRTVRERIMRPKRCGAGYLAVTLLPERQNFYIHRLVAEAFIGPARKGYEVNHIDENKENNSVKNLEWIPKRDNLLHGTRNSRCAAKGREASRKIVAMQDGIAKMEFTSMREAERRGFSRRRIHDCCEGIATQHKGFQWAYAENGGMA